MSFFSLLFCFLQKENQGKKVRKEHREDQEDLALPERLVLNIFLFLNIHTKRISSTNKLKQNQEQLG